MKPYIYRGLYTSAAWKRLTSKPRDIGMGLKKSIESFRGSVIACFMMSNDPIGFVEFPDDLTANAWGAHLSTQEGIKDVEITPLTPTSDFKESLELVYSKRDSHDESDEY